MIIIGLDYGTRHNAVAMFDSKTKSLTIHYDYHKHNTSIDACYDKVLLMVDQLVGIQPVRIFLEKIDRSIKGRGHDSDITIRLYDKLRSYFKEHPERFKVAAVFSSRTKAWQKQSFFKSLHQNLTTRLNLEHILNPHCRDAIDLVIYGIICEFLMRIRYDEQIHE